MEKLYTSKEAMDYLQVSRPTLLKLIARGVLRAQRVGPRFRFTEDDIKAALRPEVVGADSPRGELR